MNAQPTFWQRIKCFFGFHKKYKPFGFVRRCRWCGALWETSYYQWRADGWPYWKKVKPEEMTEYRQQKLKQHLREDF